MTKFIGTDTGSQGGLFHLTIAGPNYFHFNKSFTQSFVEGLDLPKGIYTVSVSAATTGNFQFNITGDLISVDPKVPDSFNNTTRMYDLTV